MAKNLVLVRKGSNMVEVAVFSNEEDDKVVDSGGFGCEGAESVGISIWMEGRWWWW